MSTPVQIARWFWPDSVEDDGPLALWRERAWRWLVAVLVAAGLVLGARELRLALRPELAKAATWRLSSSQFPEKAAGRGFDVTSEGLPNMFFQTTNEVAPWIEFDLGATRDVTTVWIQNRLDCCRDWPVPLAVELSTDRTRWTEVARRVEPFDTWRTVFPEARARYVRLRVPRPTQLQLGWVEIR